MVRHILPQHSGSYAIMYGMEAQRDIISVTDHLEKQIRREIVYVRGYEVMYRERYLEYLRDLRKARWCGDYHRAEQIIDGLRVFVGESRRLQGKGSAAYGRLVGLAARRGFTASAGAEALTPEERFVQKNDEDIEASSRG